MGLRPSSASARLCATAAVAALASFSMPAWAQEGRASAAALAEAREDFRKGIAKEAAEDWEGALRIFKAVALVKSSPQVRFHIAMCEEKIGDWVQALGSYRLAAYEGRQARAADVVSAAEKALARLEPKIPKLSLQRGDGAGVATVVLDGQQLGPASIGTPIAINPGQHHIEASAPGRKTVTLDVTLAEGENKTVDLILAKTEAQDSVVFRGEGAARKPKDEAKPEPEAGTSPLKIAGFVAGGVGIAGLAAGGVFLALKQGAIGDLDAACGPDRKSCPRDLESTVDKGETYATISTATFIGGAAALVIGVGLVILAPSPKQPPRLGVIVGPAGVVVRGAI